MTENISEGREYYRSKGILLEYGIKYLNITGNIYKHKRRTMYSLHFQSGNLLQCMRRHCIAISIGGGCMLNEQKCVPLIC